MSEAYTYTSLVAKWSMDIERVTRLRRVCRFSRRTSFIIDVLGHDLEGMDERLVKQLVRTVCEDSNIEYAPPRGRSFTTANRRSVTAIQLFHASILMGLLLNVRHGGLTKAMQKSEMVDRLLFAYERWLLLYGEDEASAPVSFELFWFLYTETASRRIELSNCKSCGSTYLNVAIGPVARCPMCSTLNLVRLVQSDQANRSRLAGGVPEQKLHLGLDRLTA